MKKYELVCVIDAGIQTADIKKVKETIEEMLGSHLVEKDDIGLLPLAYALNGQDQAYFLSYFIQVEQKNLEELKTFLRIEKTIAKFFFYGMKEKETFLKLADVQKTIDGYVQEEEARKARKPEADTEEGVEPVVAADESDEDDVA